MIQIVKIITDKELDDYDSAETFDQINTIGIWRQEAIDFANITKFRITVLSESHLKSFKDKNGKNLFVDIYEKTHDNGR